MSKSKLVKSSLIYTIGNLLLQGMAFITLPIYTRVISQEVFGQYSLYVSWVGIFTLFIGLQTSGSFTTAKVKFEDEYESYVSHCMTLSTIFFLCCFIVVYVFKSQLAQILDLSEMVVLLMVIQSYLAYTTSLLGIYFISYQRATMNLLLSAFTAISTVVLSLYLVSKWSDDFMARVVGGFIPLLISTIIVISYIYRQSKTFIRRNFLSFSLSVSTPIIFHMLGHQILNQMDRLMIGRMLTTVDVALYSFGYSLGMLISLVLGNLNTAWTPWFFENKKQGMDNLAVYIKRYLAVAVFLTLGYLTVYPELAMLMGGSRYQASIGFIPLIIVSYFISFLYTFPVNIQFYHANTKTIPIGTLFAGLVNIGLNLILIPMVGIYGAAFATVLSYIALLVFHHLVARKRYDYTEVGWRTYLILIIVVSAYAILMKVFVNSLLIRWGGGILVIVFYGFYFKEDVQKVIESYENKRLKF